MPPNPPPQEVIPERFFIARWMDRRKGRDEWLYYVVDSERLERHHKAASVHETYVREEAEAMAQRLNIRVLEAKTERLLSDDGFPSEY